MRLNSINRAICVLACVCSACAIHAADDTLPAEIQPALRADFSADGFMTWWLVSPPRESTPPNTPVPSNAREGEAAFAGADGAPCNWATVISETFFNDFRAQLGGKKGPIYAAARVFSETGGQRIFYIQTYCAVKVFFSNKQAAAYAQPAGMTVFKTMLTLPKGLSEIVLEITPRGDKCLIQGVMHDGRGNGAQPKPVPGDSIVIPTAKGKVPDQGVAAFQSFNVEPKVPFVLAPGGKAALISEVKGSLSRGADGLDVRIVNAKGEPAAGPAPISIKGLYQTEYIAPTEPSVVYEARMEFLANGKSLGIKSTSVYCLESLSAYADAAMKDWQARSAKSGHSMPNTKLAIEKLRLNVDGILNRTIPADAETGKELLSLVENAKKFAPIEEQGKDPLEGQAGYMERAYTSPIDDGVQPIIVAVPGAAVARNDTKFPLVIFLHGYDPNMNKHRWWEARDYGDVCTRNGCFLAIPFGRLNSDYQSVGEVDILDVIKDMQAHYRIDPDRIYLCGISMGGMGVYSVTAHYPDLFAAGMVLAGRADSPLQNGSALENFHPFKQWLISTDRPISLCENLTNVPLRIYHGQDDAVVPPQQATRIADALKKAGCNATLQLVPGGHRAGFDILRDDEPLRWLLSNKRNAAPATRKMKSYSLDFAKQGNLEVTAVTGEMIPIEAEWKEANGKAEAPEKESKSIAQKKLNGVLMPELAARLMKAPGLCGPVREAIRAPFTIVYGTTGSAAANTRNKSNAERFADEWLGFTRSPAKIKADKDVTPEDKRDRNLFLFGEEQDNALHAALAKDLPIAIRDGKVTIAGKTVPLGGGGIIYIYPSALAGMKRAVVICAGIPYGEQIGINHKLDLVPDFLLYESGIDTDGTSTNKPACAGFFNGEWKFEAKTTWWFDK